MKHKPTTHPNHSNVDQYLSAANRVNTTKSYLSAVEHFEVHWGGMLPSTSDQIAQYLADFAPTLSVNTLKQRLSALAVWHKEHGFPDPTKAPHVKKVLKGINRIHAKPAKQARPLLLEELQAVIEYLDDVIQAERASSNTQQSAVLLQAMRNKALLLLGFWRAFRSDELVNSFVEHINARAGEGMEIYLPHSKTDHKNEGKTFKVPALKILCPVDAYLDWIYTAQLKSGPVFRSIDRWGKVSEQNLHSASVINIIKNCCANANIENAHFFTSHSLRRGFATWANEQNWEMKALMEYVGWRDIKSALRYIELKDPFGNLSISNQHLLDN